MPNIISKRERITVPKFNLFWEHLDCPGAGIGLDCDKNGNLTQEPTEVIVDPAAYRRELDADPGLVFRGIQDYTHTYTQPAILGCECGAEVALSNGYDNECSQCGRLYNGFGQGLRPRHQWEEPEDED